MKTVSTVLIGGLMALSMAACSTSNMDRAGGDMNSSGRSASGSTASSDNGADNNAGAGATNNATNPATPTGTPPVDSGSTQGATPMPVTGTSNTNR